MTPEPTQAVDIVSMSPGLVDCGLQAFLDDRATATWIKNVVRFLPVKSQFILAGNIRDFYPFPIGPEGVSYQPLPLRHYLRSTLALAGYQWFISYNPLGEFEVVAELGPAEDAARKFFADKFALKFDAARVCRADLNDALGHIERIINWREHFIAVFLDFASRLTVRADALDEHSNESFTRALMLSHSVRPHTTVGVSQAQFNPVFWFCDKENDLPAWLPQDNPRIKSIVVPRPDNAVRSAPVDALCAGLSGYKETPAESRKRLLEEFVDQTEGMSLADMIAIAELCRREKLPLSQIAEAVRRYKVGVTDDPWRRIPRDKIVRGREEIARRVKGQNPAVTKALDIIKRAIAGLSGAQGGARTGGKPRGVLFLAGPSGVGKTELAKSLTELLFGDETSYIRFDMSEFSAEHADQRLLGAPPGYVGYDSGGELTNAIKQKPFSVVLFDEIEKAHPRLLDKFLQILDDGVLTSGRGERVYFSESVIIFTSNLGIYRVDESGRRVLNVVPTDPYEKVESCVRQEIARYFK